MQKIKQSTSLSCLTTCILYLLSEYKNIKINKKLELKIFLNALTLFRDDYVMGHLDYVTNKFKLKADWYIEIKTYADFLKKINKNKNIKIYHKEISIDFINKLLKNNFKPIVYIDDYIINKTYHFPHFVLINKKRKYFEVFEPWDGEIKYFSSEELHEGIRNLKNILWITPEVIVLRLF